VNPRMRIFVELALAMGLLVPVALAQKPPAPAPPPSAPPSHPATPTPSSTPPGQPREDLVMFLLGRVATDDGTPVPHDVLVERVCNARVRQQVYATSRGDFSMELGSMNDSYLDASGDRSPQYGEARKVPGTGISRLELTNCELRATVSGFGPMSSTWWTSRGHQRYGGRRDRGIEPKRSKDDHERGCLQSLKAAEVV
jgi:hypothetical protein